MIFKYNCGDIVEHEKYGSGLVKQRWLSASGVNELYDVLFIKGLSTDGVKRVIGSELSLVRSVSPGSKLPRLALQLTGVQKKSLVLGSGSHNFSFGGCEDK